jgi:hypothetical protein
LAAVVLGVRNATYDFATYPFGPYVSIRKDLKYIPAYQWLAREASPTALVLVDDGFDWQRAMDSAGDVSDNAKTRRAMALYVCREDLFSIVARRRRVHHLRLYGDALTTADYQTLRVLHFGTFGYMTQCSPEDYRQALSRFPPDYALWRKCLPVPRACGATVLQDISHRVYGDDACEIWQMNYCSDTHTTQPGAE